MGWQLEDDRDSATYHERDAHRDATPDSSHACANLVDGELKCWGENASYQLTDVAPPESGTPPTTIPEMSEVYEVAVGDDFTCARQTGRRVECWGDNARGQLGNDRGGEDGSEAVSARPTLVSGLANVIDIDAGRATACARDLDGRVFCWGDNSYGQVRRHTSDYQHAYEPAPIESEFVGVRGFERAAGLCVGEGHVCAIEYRSGAVTCWGRNTEGAVGEHSYEEWALDTKMLDAVTVTCGAHFTCALLEDGQVRCWGSNSHGQLGRANFPNVVQKSHRDLPAEGLHDVVALDAGEAHVCAVQSDGTVWCWGANDHGQLGDGTNEYKRAPVETLF